MTLAEISQIILAGIALISIGAVIGRILFGQLAAENETTEMKGEIIAIQKEQLETKLILRQILKRLRMPS